MRNISTFHRLATAAIEKTAGGNAEGQKITLNVIKQRMGDTLYKLTSQTFEDPGGWRGAAYRQWRGLGAGLGRGRQISLCRKPHGQWNGGVRHMGSGMGGPPTSC